MGVDSRFVGSWYEEANRLGAILSIKTTLKNKVVAGEILGLFMAILTCWVTELFDPLFSFQQVLIESLVLIIQ